MNDKYKEIGAGLAVVGSIVYAFQLFMDWTGIPPDLEANFGIAVKDLFWVVSVILLIVATTRFLHCYGIAGAGADPIGIGPRDKYDALRKSLAAHEDAKDGYARRLKAFLAKIDAFFGDADLAMQRFYVLREQAALWTAPAFDRCLLLALFYPVAAIFVIWVVSGEVGPAERGLGLNAAAGPQRLVALAAAGFIILPFWNVLRSPVLAWLIAVASASVLLVVSAPAIATLALAGVTAAFFSSTFALTFAGVVALALVFTGIFCGIIAALAISAFAFAGGVAANIAGLVASTGVGVGVGVGIFAIARNMSGGMGEKSQAAFVSIMFLAGLAAARYLSPFPVWNIAGPLALFLVLLTLVNAPFDWLSLGLTRFLLRRGIEQGGPWPYFYALIDALAASALIALLAVAMVGATDLFDHLAELGGGDKARVLPPMRVFLDDLRAAPQTPEYWWATPRCSRP